MFKKLKDIEAVSSMGDHDHSLILHTFIYVQYIKLILLERPAKEELKHIIEH